MAVISGAYRNGERILRNVAASTALMLSHALSLRTGYRQALLLLLAISIYWEYAPGNYGRRAAIN